MSFKRDSRWDTGDKSTGSQEIGGVKPGGGTASSYPLVSFVSGSTSSSSVQQPQQPSGGFATGQATLVKYPVLNASRVGQASTAGSADTGTSMRQRVFTGMVTKLHNDYGFIDDDVIFQKSCVQGQIPSVGDRCIVEATYQANMPFKWNATRVQPIAGSNQNQQSSQAGYGQQQQQMFGSGAGGLNQAAAAAAAAVAMALQSVGSNQNGSAALQSFMAQGFQQGFQQQQGGFMQQGYQQQGGMSGGMGQGGRFQQGGGAGVSVPSLFGATSGGRAGSGGPEGPPRRRRDRSPPRERIRRERDQPRKRSRTPAKSPQRTGSVSKKSVSPRRSSRSPSERVRRRAAVRPVYNVQIPQISLDIKEATVMQLKTRYSSLYLPSDFFSVAAGWPLVFPPQRPLQLGHTCNFHVMSKKVPRCDKNSEYVETADSDRSYSAKVMLMSCPLLDDLYHKTCSLAEDPPEMRDEFVHPTRLIKFLVGLRGKSEPMAIGGSWSPSLDGADPVGDPRVLINTAVRTTKMLTGIDLSSCTQWYRFAEIRYHRAEEKRRGSVTPARVETVVIFLPDVWSCTPLAQDWAPVVSYYRDALETAVSKMFSEAGVEPSTFDGGKKEDTEIDTKAKEDDLNTTMDDSEGGETGDNADATPTHHSKLDPKNMLIADLRRELDCRKQPVKGLKTQLVARLAKILKQEEEDEEEEKKKLSETPVVQVVADPANPTQPESSDAVKEDPKAAEEAAAKAKAEAEAKAAREVEREKERLKRKKEDLEKLYSVPESPVIIVNPSSTARGGKFDCSVMSLSVLLDYREEDNKEHSFEVSLFAELFNEMLMRDFGLNIYKHLYATSIRVEREKREESERKAKEDAEKKKKEEVEKKADGEKKENGKDDAKKEEVKTESKSEKSDDKMDSSEKVAGKDNGTAAVDDGEPPSKVAKTEESDKDKEEKEKPKEKRERKKYTTVDRDLLLSFVYFDQSHAGFIRSRDLEDLLQIIGLKLSRAQIKTLLQSVDCKETLNYRRLTDREIKEGETAVTVQIKEEVKEEPVVLGNLELLQQLTAGADSSSDSETTKYSGDGKGGLIMHRGAMIDIESVMQRLGHSEKQLMEAEVKLRKSQQEIVSLRSSLTEKAAEEEKASRKLQEMEKKQKEESSKVVETSKSADKYKDMLSVVNNTLTHLQENIQQTLGTANADK